MIHNLETEPRDGHYFHKCLRCGIEKTTATPKWVGECKPRKGMGHYDRDVFNAPCKFLGDATGDNFTCKGCPGSPRVHATFACSVHGSCLPLATVAGIHCCTNCREYEAKIPAD